MVADPVEDLLIPEPGRRACVHFQRRRVEVQQMAAILQRGDMDVERLPGVGDDHDPAGRL